MRIRLGVLRAIILAESRYSDVKSRYPEVDVDQLRAADPSGQKLKYLQWMAKQVSQGYEPEEVIETVTQFHNNVNKMSVKDINSFKVLDDLETAVETAATKQTSREKRSSAKSGAEVIYEDDGVTVMHIGTRDACILYGKNTQWCITQKKDDQYWNEYMGQNSVFYYIFRKELENDDFDKIAVHVPRGQTLDSEPIRDEIEFYDASDRSVSLKVVDHAIGGGAHHLLADILEDAKSRPPTLAAKVIAAGASEAEQLEAVKRYARSFDVMAEVIPRLTSPAALAYVIQHIDDTDLRDIAINNPSVPADVLLELISKGKREKFIVALYYTGDSKAVWNALLSSGQEVQKHILNNNDAAPQWVRQKISTSL